MKSTHKAPPLCLPQSLITLTLGLSLFPLTFGCSKSSPSAAHQPHQTKLESSPASANPPSANPPSATPSTAPATDKAPSPPNSNVAPNPSTPSLIIEVRGFKDSQGQCRIALYQGKDGFNQPNQAILKSTQPIPSENPNPYSVIWPIDQSTLEQALAAPPNSNANHKLAVSAHHDKNSNDKLDKNPLGIPTEPYGFSKNPKRGFGPPSFEEVQFDFPPNTETDSENSPTRIIIEIR